VVATVVIATTTMMRVVVVAAAAAALPHRLPARTGAAPPGHPTTTPRLAPSTCIWAHPGHRSHLGRRTPSSLHRWWRHRSRLLWRLCLFLMLCHLNSSPGRRGQGSGIHSPSSAPSAPWSSLPRAPSPMGWPTLAPPTTPPHTQVASPLPTPPFSFPSSLHYRW
jgi:hypothetical protein